MGTRRTAAYYLLRPSSEPAHCVRPAGRYPGRLARQLGADRQDTPRALSAGQALLTRAAFPLHRWRERVLQVQPLGARRRSLPVPRNVTRMNSSGKALAAVRGCRPARALTRDVD